MKRIGAIVCLIMMLVLMSASVCFAGQGDLVIKEQYPKDGATGTAVENASIKIWFNQDVRPKTTEIRKANKKAVHLVDEKGKEVPIYVAYSGKEEGLMMVLSSNEAKIEGKTKYTLTIDQSFQATSGDTLAEGNKVTFKTLDQSQTMRVNMIMMVVMMVGMIFFSTKSMKKQMEKENAEKGKQETVNPYKEAKRTGKSVEEIVEKDRKNKEKQAAAAAKREAKRAKVIKEEEEDSEVSSSNKRVAGPRPISAAGGKYKAPKKASSKNENHKGTTRPKNQTGKQKNSKKRK